MSEIIDPNEVPLDMHHLKIPEGKKLELGMKIEGTPLKVIVRFENLGYDVTQDEYNFAVGHIVLDERQPPRNNGNNPLIIPG